MNNSFNTIIFDLGGVLVDWNPRYVYQHIFDTEEKMQWFFDNICTFDWNEEQDAGRSLADGTQVLLDKFPEHSNEIKAYYGRWKEMLGDPLSGTVEIFRRLKASGKYKIYALTNWSDETFPIALERYDFLHWFDGIVVSGAEKMRKPTPAFYKILLDRYQVDAASTVFIDDNLRNIKAAAALDIHSIPFTSSEQLEKDLEALGV